MRGKAEPHAASILANLVGIGVQGEEGASQSLMPATLVNALLANEDLWGSMPVIRTYALRPVFDGNYCLCGPGWHPEQGILVHGPDIDPAQEQPVTPQVVRVKSV